MANIYLSNKQTELLLNIITEYSCMMSEGEETIELLNEISDDLSEIENKLIKSKNQNRSTKSLVDEAIKIALELKEKGKI